MAKKLKLTYYPNRDCWSKFYQGKRYYCPIKVSGKSDRQGYADSLEWWEAKKAELDNTPVRGAADPVNGVQSIALPTIPMATNYGKVGVSASPLSVKPKFADRTVSGLIDEYLSARKNEADSGQISAKMYSEHRYCIDDFRAFAKHSEVEKIEDASASLLASYRETQLQLTTLKKSAGGVSPVTAKKRLQILKRFFEWLEDLEIIDRLPKVLGRKFAAVKLPPPKPEVFTLDEIWKLWDVAPKRTKLYICLGLNCGYKQADISSLTHEMVDWSRGLILRQRHKTSAVQIHKLWPITLELLQREKSSGSREDFLLLTTNGTELKRETIKSDGSMSETNIVKLALDRAKRKLDLPITGKGFATFRSTAASEVEKINDTVTSAFLAHTETATKKHYVSTDFEHLLKSEKYIQLFDVLEKLDTEVFKLGKR